MAGFGPLSWSPFPYGPVPSSGVPSLLYVDLFNNQTNIAGQKTWTGKQTLQGNSTNCFYDVVSPGGGGNKFGYLFAGGQYGSILSDPASATGMRFSALNLGLLSFGFNTNSVYPGHTYTESMRLDNTNVLSVLGNATTGTAQIKASAFGNAAKVFVERTNSSAISWSMGTGGNSSLTFRNETGGTDLVTINTSGVITTFRSASTVLGNARAVDLRSIGSASERTEIGLGYGPSTTFLPVVIGHTPSDNTGNTKGSFYVATRDVTTDTAPTIRLQVNADGSVETPVSLKIGASGTFLTQVRVYSPSLAPVAVAANSTAEQTFTVTGLSTADNVEVNVISGTALGCSMVAARVSAADTLALTFANVTGGSLTPVNATYRIIATRS